MGARTTIARATLGLVVAAALALAACGGDDEKAAESPAGSSGTTEVPEETPAGTEGPAEAGRGDAITVKGFLFKPNPVMVSAGTEVTWTNEDEILHTATAGVPGAQETTFDGTMDEAGATFSFTFAEPGTYKYFCTRHNSMTGEVTVS